MQHLMQHLLPTLLEQRAPPSPQTQQTRHWPLADTCLLRFIFNLQGFELHYAVNFL
jgi:hypothetical protein